MVRRDPRPLTHTTEVDNFLDSAKPYSFAYKRPEDAMSTDPTKAHGRFLGTMAQSLEQNPYGRQIVDDTPHGKVLQIKPLVSALTASVGRIHQRLDQHEKALTHLHGLLAAQRPGHVGVPHMHAEGHGESERQRIAKVLSAKFGPR